MMLLRLPLRFALALMIPFLAGLVSAQDLHFTLHNMTPLAFNPANSGNFYGSYRISALYRDQYRSVAGGAAYSTPTFSIDAPVIRGFGEKDWVGVGVFFYNDKSGAGALTQSSYKISGAYHWAMDKEGNNVLSIAYQTGGVQRRLKNPANLRFEDGLVSGDPSTSLDLAIINMDQKGKSFLDHVGGLKFTSNFNQTDQFFIGIAAGKFGRPDWSLITAGSNYRVDPRAHLQIGMSTEMSDRMRFSPNISYQKVMNSAANTLVVQGMVDYLYNAEKRLVMLGGLGYRSGANIGDAIQVMVGADVKDIRVMLGYDLNISSLSAASSSQGGFELAVQYMGKIYKRPNPDPIIFCPRF